jgi:prophage regulatory protein
MFIKRKEVERMVGLSYPTILKLERSGVFPRPKQLTEGRVGWLYSEVLDWAMSRDSSEAHS